MRALQLNPPSCWGPAVRKGTSGRGHKVARVPAALPTGNSSVSRGAGWAPNAHSRPKARPGSETASVNAGPAGGSRPARRPRPGRPVPSRPGAPFPSVPRRRPRPALPPSQGSPSSKRSSGRRAPEAAMARRSRGRGAAVARPAGGRVHRLERPRSCGAGTEGTLRPAAPVT